MKITNAKFITSVASAQQYATFSHKIRNSEICVVGRSNVGKSSFINKICASNVARTSSTPGRTRLINCFDINNGLFTLIDLPGYGFAKASKKEKDEWDALIGGYFENSSSLIHVFVLVDLRIPPTDLDVQMLKYLYHFGIQFTVVATKADKLSRVQQDKGRQVVASTLAIGKDNVIVFSSENGQGVDAVMSRISQIIEK